MLSIGASHDSYINIAEVHASHQAGLQIQSSKLLKVMHAPYQVAASNLAFYNSRSFHKQSLMMCEQELVRSRQPFSTTDYMAPTPSWAIYDAPEHGFDPGETRLRKVRNHGRAPTGVA